jgi:hypothetical protein
MRQESNLQGGQARPGSGRVPSPVGLRIQERRAENSNPTPCGALSLAARPGPRPVHSPCDRRRTVPGTRTLTTRALNAVPLPVGLGRHVLGADNGPRTRDLHHGEVALFPLSYIRAEPSAGFAPAPSSLPRKRPDSGTARAMGELGAQDSNLEPPGSRPGGFRFSTAHLGAFGPARTGCLPLTKRLLYLVSYEGLVSSVRFERTLPAPRAGASCQLGYEDIGAAVRCRSGPPALRRRGRSRARRRRCPPWIRTTTVRTQNAASCQLDQRASVRETRVERARREVWAREVCQLPHSRMVRRQRLELRSLG